MSLRVSDQVRLKPACSATEASMRLEILVTETRDITLSRQRTTKALIRLRLICAFVGCIWHKTRFHMAWLIFILFRIKIPVSKQWRPWSDTRSAASDLGLQGLPLSQTWNTRVNIKITSLGEKRCWGEGGVDYNMYFMLIFLLSMLVYIVRVIFCCFCFLFLSASWVGVCFRVI